MLLASRYQDELALKISFPRLVRCSALGTLAALAIERGSHVVFGIRDPGADLRDGSAQTRLSDEHLRSGCKPSRSDRLDGRRHGFLG